MTIPFKNHRQVPVGALVGKVVIDTNNYYHERDGHYLDIDNGTATVSGLLAEHLPTSRIVKAFNMVQALAVNADARPAGAPARRALPFAGDDARAQRTVTELIDEFGFDVVDAGPLVEGRRFDRDKPAYGAYLTAPELTAALAAGRSGRPDCGRPSRPRPGPLPLTLHRRRRRPMEPRGRSRREQTR